MCAPGCGGALGSLISRSPSRSRSGPSTSMASGAWVRPGRSLEERSPPSAGRSASPWAASHSSSRRVGAGSHVRERPEEGSPSGQPAAVARTASSTDQASGNEVTTVAGDPSSASRSRRPSRAARNWRAIPSAVRGSGRVRRHPSARRTASLRRRRWPGCAGGVPRRERPPRVAGEVAGDGRLAAASSWSRILQQAIGGDGEGAVAGSVALPTVPRCRGAARRRAHDRRARPRRLRRGRPEEAIGVVASGTAPGERRRRQVLRRVAGRPAEHRRDRPHEGVGRLEERPADRHRLLGPTRQHEHDRVQPGDELADGRWHASNDIASIVASDPSMSPASAASAASNVPTKNCSNGCCGGVRERSGCAA